MAQIFECKQCGSCCQGRGGIVLTERDLARVADFLSLSVAETVARYCEEHNGKWKIKAGDDGWCCFFEQGRGCAIHPSKPDVCRAWPFFRGNLLDAQSFALARDYCPGISREADFHAFALAGFRTLNLLQLLTNGDMAGPNALKITAEEMGAAHGPSHQAD